MSLCITILSENTAGMGGFLGEWGLSVLIEFDAIKILLDTGAAISCVHNADALGIDLSTIDKIVLSHGHYDHTGGLREVLRRMRKEVEIIAHPDLFQAKYSRRGGKADRYAGMPFRREELESLGARFHLSRQSEKLSEKILTTGEVPMVTEYETVDSALFIKEDSGFQPDPVMDDQAVIIRTESGLVVILGCAHRGMINTLYYAQKISGITPVNAVIGGSHLMGSSQERIWQSIAALRQIGVRKLGLCHCTDLPVISLLSQEFGDSFIFVKSGMRIEFP